MKFIFNYFEKRKATKLATEQKLREDTYVELLELRKIAMENVMYVSSTIKTINALLSATTNKPKKREYEKRISKYKKSLVEEQVMVNEYNTLIDGFTRHK